MTDRSVLYTARNHIGVITINRPENRNSMDAETLNDFSEILEKIKDNRALRCLIITGSGTTFCGGADLKSSVVGDGSELTPDVLMEFYRPFMAVGSLEMPVIAAMNGHAVGGGFGLALHCDIRIAGRDIKMGANFSRLGIHAGMAVTYLLPRLVGTARACELLFTGKLITGSQALDMGLVNQATDQAQVMPRAMAMAEEIAKSAPAAVRMMKQSLYRELDWDPVRAAGLEALHQARTFAMDDAAEGIAALLEKRDPMFTGK